MAELECLLCGRVLEPKEKVIKAQIAIVKLLEDEFGKPVYYTEQLGQTSRVLGQCCVPKPLFDKIEKGS